MKYELFEGTTLIDGAAIALEARLYVSGWDLRRSLSRMQREGGSGMPQAKLAIAFDGKHPVAICAYDGRYLAAFCRVSHRGRGIASGCVRTLGDVDVRRAREGVVGTMEFWKKNQVPCKARPTW
jgi:hypothetical protein